MLEVDRLLLGHATTFSTKHAWRSLICCYHSFCQHRPSAVVFFIVCVLQSSDCQSDSSRDGNYACWSVKGRGRLTASYYYICVKIICFVCSTTSWKKYPSWLPGVERKWRKNQHSQIRNPYKRGSTVKKLCVEHNLIRSQKANTSSSITCLIWWQGAWLSYTVLYRFKSRSRSHSKRLIRVGEPATSNLPYFVLISLLF